MKTITTLATLFLLTSLAFGQSEKYTKAMEKTVAQYDTTRSVEGLQALLNQFERIGTVEKNQWLPYYYAGMSAMRLANRDDKARIDSWAEKSDGFAAKADSLGGDRSELQVLRALNDLARINVDFMSRGPQFVGQAGRKLQEAGRLNPENPRVYLVQGQVKINTPPMFGGDKAAGCAMVAKAAELLESRAADKLNPHWGREDAKAVLKRCGEQASK